MICAEPRGVAERPRAPALDGLGTEEPATRSLWPTFLLSVAAAGLLGAEIIHCVVIKAHMAEWFPAGIFFGALGLVEGFLAVGLLIAPGRKLHQAVAVVSLLTVCTWAAARTIGHPGGPDPWHPESIGVIDGACTVFEQLTFIAVFQLLRTEGYATARVRWDRDGRRVVTAVALVFSVAAFVAIHAPVVPHLH